ncbi:hypothetical protein B0H11DRAFT_1930815 [Mycena galericulata]|nr:hypothetical protein B0H11DRAFT_1930815 [Mycena galericulata]
MRVIFPFLLVESGVSTIHGHLTIHSFGYYAERRRLLGHIRSPDEFRVKIDLVTAVSITYLRYQFPLCHPATPSTIPYSSPPFPQSPIALPLLLPPPTTLSPGMLNSHSSSFGFSNSFEFRFRTQRPVYPQIPDAAGDYTPHHKLIAQSIQRKPRRRWGLPHTARNLPSSCRKPDCATYQSLEVSGIQRSSIEIEEAELFALTTRSRDETLIMQRGA